MPGTFEEDEACFMVQKLLVIGLDGATFDLILPWVKAGKLPALKRLIQDGISGPLESTYPPLTGTAWSSFMTGKSPAQHGLLEFFRRQDGTYRQVLNNRLDMDGKSIWKHLSEGDKSVGVMGVPLTYPPEPVNGFLITGLLTPPGRRDFTYPVDLLSELETHIGEYHLRLDEKYRANNPYPFINELNENLKNNTQAALYLLNHKEWDFFMVHFYGTDRVQHEFWHLLDPAHPDHNPEELARLGNVIEDFFIKVDQAVGKILEAVDANTAVMLMSDHGFGPIYKFINFNNWLLQEGLLKLKNKPGTYLRRKLLQLGFNYTVLGKWILKLGLGKQSVRMGRAKREELQRRIFLSLNDVDWSKSKVYSMGNFGQLFVNLKGREPMGIVSPGAEYEAVLNDLTQRLQNLVDPEDGKPVIEKVMRRDEVFQGTYADRAPDLMFYTRNMQYKAMGLSDFASSNVFDPVFGSRGHHRMNGILICKGQNVFKENAQIENARIYDLAPTILYLLGRPVPSEMDGQVLMDLFTHDFREKHRVQHQVDPSSDKNEDSNILTEEEEAVLADMLRSLGYIK
jgi:predicted AlkP superfamily phosphohydrolase/phosphomutase